MHIHQITDMEDDRVVPVSTKRPIDLADDLHKAIDEARRVLSDIPMSTALKRWSKRLKMLPTEPGAGAA